MLSYLYAEEDEDGVFSDYNRRFTTTRLLQGALVRLRDIPSPTEVSEYELRLAVDFHDWRDHVGCLEHQLNGYEDGFDGLAPVEQSGKNEWGLYGVGGNAWEVCLDGKARGASCKEWVQNALRIDHREFVARSDSCVGVRFDIGRIMPKEVR